MTYTSKELERRGFPPNVVGVRRWRRARGLTIRSMAIMLGVTANQLHKFETQARDTPRRNKQIGELYEAFVERWAKVPEVQFALEQQVHRDKLARSAVASARRRKVVEDERRARSAQG